MKRILIDILFLLSVFLFPWWIVLVALTVTAFMIDSFYEMLFFGVIIDSLYNAPIARFHHVEFVVTFGALFLFVCTEVLKRRLRFNR